MKIPEFKRKSSKMEEEIEKLYSYLGELIPESEEYSKVVDNISKLQKIKCEHKKTVTPDALIAVGGNLLGLVLIMNYEKVDIFTTKALGFVIKGRV